MTSHPKSMWHSHRMQRIYLPAEYWRASYFTNWNFSLMHLGTGMCVARERKSIAFLFFFSLYLPSPISLYALSCAAIDFVASTPPKWNWFMVHFVAIQTASSEVTKKFCFYTLLINEKRSKTRQNINSHTEMLEAQNVYQCDNQYFY